MNNEIQRERNEKPKIIAQNKHVPKDAQVIMSIMKELNVPDYEPRVINQLLEFTYRYVTCILDDAKVYANHARKKTIDLEDVKLATEMALDKTFTTPPPRHVLAKLAEVRNSMPLPPIKPHCGLRLPPDRYCLSACNYKLRALHQPKKMMKSALDSRSVVSQLKTTHLKASQLSAGSLIKRPNAMPPKTQVISIPKPVIKFSTIPKPMPDKSEIASTLSDIGVVKMEEDDVASTSGMKRKRDDDEFEVVP